MDEKILGFQKPYLDEKICFFTIARSPESKGAVQFLLKSLQTFGGSMRNHPVLIFQMFPDHEAELGLGGENVHVIPVDKDHGLRHYWFGDKVYVCSLAEKLVQGHVHSLVWLSAQCLILHPPVHLDLENSYGAAFRPVHIKNIGLAVDEPLNAFWRAVYDSVGIDECPYAVQSLVDGHKIRAYFNTHLFSVDPSVGILQTWLDRFREMISDHGFQSGPCNDQGHQIFLHQAILSALTVKMLDWQKVRILPNEYSYPLHLHSDVPMHLRPESLNSQICPVYEGIYQHPSTLNGLEVHEPLNTWIVDNIPADI
jgi:hypothetical protein